MSRLEVPLLSKKVWATGDLVLRAELDLLVRDENGIWRPETFRVDSGTEMTSMAAVRPGPWICQSRENPFCSMLAESGGKFEQASCESKSSAWTVLSTSSPVISWGART